MKRWITLLILLSVCRIATANEVQHHGVVFERWIQDTFFDGYRPHSYTQKWDIPASANKKFGGIAVNPKATKYKGAVDLGDALRQFDINEPFWLIVGYWQQEGEAKRFVNVVAARVEPQQWRALWGDLKRSDLERLDKTIKQTPDYREARRLAQKIKREPPFQSSIITLNPKIDSKSQRRLQCSLSWSRVFKNLAPGADPSVQKSPLLWGVPVNLEISEERRASARAWLASRGCGASVLNWRAVRPANPAHDPTFLARPATFGAGSGASGAARPGCRRR